MPFIDVATELEAVAAGKYGLAIMFGQAQFIQGNGLIQQEDILLFAQVFANPQREFMRTPAVQPEQYERN